VGGLRGRDVSASPHRFPCQVPAYRGTEDDWDTDELQPMAQPYVPPLMAWLVTISFASLIGALVYFQRTKPRSGDTPPLNQR
jgi:hypothetical protein